MIIPFLIGILLMTSLSIASASDIDSMLASYRDEGATGFSAERGKLLWTSTRLIDGEERACSSCHTADPVARGRHVKTGKTIEPIAVSANPERFTDVSKTEKWFRRNCKWTLGRECTPQEKGDLLTWLGGQQE
jgi:cytochrome c peroxidase